MNRFNSGQAYLQALRTQYCTDPAISAETPLREYYVKLDGILERVNENKQTQDNRKLYIYLMRYAQLATKLATHPQWHVPQNKRDRDRVNGVTDVVMEELSVLQGILINEYNQALRDEYIVRQEREEKREEMMARIGSVYVHVDRKNLTFTGSGKIFNMYEGNWKDVPGSGLVELYVDPNAQKLQIIIHETSTFWLVPPLKSKGPRGFILTLSALFSDAGESNFILAVKFNTEKEARTFALVVQNNWTTDDILAPVIRPVIRPSTNDRLYSPAHRLSYSSSQSSSRDSQSSLRDAPLYFSVPSQPATPHRRPSLRGSKSSGSSPSGRISPFSRRTSSRQSFNEYLTEETSKHIVMAERHIRAETHRRDESLSQLAAKFKEELEYSYYIPDTSPLS